jgi:outer membrane lipoprotein LolB
MNTVQNRWIRAGLVVAVALLAACSGQPRHRLNTEFSERNWEIRRSTLTAVQSFELQGRLAESGITGGRGDLKWVQSGERFDVHVTGPLGIGALAINGDPRSVEIRTKDGTFVTGSPESVMRQRLGWSLPIMQLPFWVLGLPAPMRNNPSTVILDDGGRAQTIKQAGWVIGYDEYQTVGALTLPRKLALANGERSFRIVIDKWVGTP